MKRVKIEFQVTFLTLFIAAAVIASGYLVYQSLSKIIDSIHKEARPDFKLLLIKDIAAELNEVENTVRLYSLTGDAAFFHPYLKLNESIQEKLNNLKDYALPESDEIQQIDSIRLLTNQKLLIWEEIRTLHNQKETTTSSFSDLYSKIDTVIIQPDTITFQPAEKKKGIFKRIFGKRDTVVPRPIIIDKSKEREIIKQEIAGIEQHISDQSQRLQAQEKVLLERNIQISSLIAQQIVLLETTEQRRLLTKTQEADFMAAQTYRRLSIFTITAVILLITVLILFYRNLQRNRAYERMLEKAKTEAESLAKAKEMFVATVSHEMRTPVNAIYGLTEQMLQKAHSEEMSDNLKVVHKSAQHLITLVNDTLDFSKIESQKLKIEQIDFMPDEVYKEIYTLHKDSAAARGNQLVINNRCDKNRVLKGDPVRLKQILINLITNAIKFTSQGQIIFTAAEERLSGHTWMLHLEVSDTGIGISEENLQLIFDEFVQLDTDLTMKHRGTGLGLAIVKRLIDLHDGHIQVESAPGRGTRFMIQLPYQEGDASNLKDKEIDRIRIPANFRKLHFLLVDDEEFNLYLLKNILKKWGIAYTEANNGKVAVELASSQPFDLILMDMRMPVMDGYDAARQILKIWPNIRIIALTATNRPEDIQKSQQAGMQGFLQKPFSEADLFETVTRLLPAESNIPQESDETNQQVQIDLNELQKMAGDDPAFFNEMLEIFIHSSEKGLANIRKAFAETDWEAISEAAHKLAAPAKHMQAMSLYHKLKELELNTPATKNADDAEILINTIEQEIIQINAFIREKLSEK
ncbi:MAG: ATP-binding protein [Mangrovibacterium sp.]